MDLSHSIISNHLVDASVTHKKNSTMFFKWLMVWYFVSSIVKLHKTAFSVVKSRLALGSPVVWSVAFHHAKSGLLHRKMVIDCPIVITSIGDTHFQTRQDQEWGKNGRASVFCKDNTGSYLVSILKILISTHFVYQVWRDNCCKTKSFGRRPSRDGGSHGGKDTAKCSFVL